MDAQGDVWRWGRAAVVALVIVAVGACTGGSSGAAADPTAVPSTPTIAAASATATRAPLEPATPGVPEPSEQDRIDAALAGLEAADPLPADLVAYDLIDATVSGSMVDIDVCGWEGDTVFDDVYLLSYRTSVGDDGDVGAIVESATLGVGDCTNTTLVEAALQATRNYDIYWRTVLEDPASFDPDEAAAYAAADGIAASVPIVQGWARDGLSYRHSYLDAGLPDSSQQNVLTRSYELGPRGVIELISCRPVPPEFGLYLGDVLVEDFRNDQSRGDQVINRYQLVVEHGTLVLAGLDELVWADCSAFPDSWFEGVNRQFADPVPWNDVPS